MGEKERREDTVVESVGSILRGGGRNSIGIGITRY